MSSPKPSPRKGKLLPERSMSFHGRGFTPIPQPTAGMGKVHRPKTVPNLPSASHLSLPPTVLLAGEGKPKLTKLLLNVTIQGSLGPVQLILTPESTVGDLIASAVKQYVKEGRRPVLPTTDPSEFDLHYSQFSFESLDRKQQLLQLGSRNFFLCGRKISIPLPGSDGAFSSQASCSKQAEKVTRSGTGMPWLKFMGFFLQ